MAGGERHVQSESLKPFGLSLGRFLPPGSGPIPGLGDGSFVVAAGRRKPVLTERRKMKLSIHSAHPCSISVGEAAGATNRRTFLAGSAAAAVAVAVPAKAEGLSPIAALIETERAAHAAYNAAADALEDAAEAWAAIQCGPEAVYLTVFDHHVHVSLKGRERSLEILDGIAAEVRRVLQRELGPDLYGPMIAVHDAMLDQERARINAAADRADEARAACGLPDAEAAEAAALDTLEEARHAILRFPARSPSEIDMKAEWLRAVFGDGKGSFDSDYADALLASFIG